MMNSQPNASMEGLREHLMHDPGSLGEFLRKEGYASGFAEMKCQDVIDDIMPVINALLKEAEERALKTIKDIPYGQSGNADYDRGWDDCRRCIKSSVESLSITDQSK